MARSARAAPKNEWKRTDALVRNFGRGCNRIQARENHPERSFRAYEHAIGVRSGARSRQSTCFQYAVRGYDAQAFDEIVNMSIRSSEMAARSRRDPAAKG